MAGSAEALSRYRAKRRFGETPEPSGDTPMEAAGLFVVQKHDATRLHYDFRLELDGVLKSWAVTRGPSTDPSQKRLAVRTEDHPLDYAGFEGTIPEGNYGAGTVMVWDTGQWRPLGDPHDGLKKGMLKFELAGERLKGQWVLVLMKTRSDEKRENWLLIKEKDDEVDREHDILREHDTSVLSGRSLAEIEKGPPKKAVAKAKKKVPGGSLPAFVEPQLATLVEEVPDGKGWLYEIKFDGYRAQFGCAGDKVRILTRSGLDWTDKFKTLAEAAADLALDGAILDGEIVAVDANGATDFSELVRRLKAGNDKGLAFFAFDLLMADGADMKQAPLEERKARLRELLQDAPKKGPIFYTDHLEGGGAKMLKQLCAKGFEGIVAKRADSAYRSGRQHGWLKIKCQQGQEFVIVGTAASTRGRPFASLLLAVREGGGLRYVGKVGAGLGADAFDMLAPHVKRLARKQRPAGIVVPKEVEREASWLKPELVAEIAFAGFTGDGSIRHGRFKGLREDKPAKEVTMETPDDPDETSKPATGAKNRAKARPAAKSKAGSDDETVLGVRLTHPAKVFYPDEHITKADVAHYYERVAPLMLPFVKDRLVSLVRCPEGETRACFFQKHRGTGLPDALKSLDVKESDGSTNAYLYLQDAAALASMAQIGALECHIWGSSIADIEKPDRLVFDLDPDVGLPFAAVKEAALRLRDVLDALGLKTFPMLTGGKGVHVVAPIQRRHAWPTISAFAKALAQRIADDKPDRYVAVMSKKKREGRLFIDYLRNQRGATAVAPYSTRAREGAPVAWPITWAELNVATSANPYRLKQILEAMPDNEDAWADYRSCRQSLKDKALSALGVEPGG